MLQKEMLKDFNNILLKSVIKKLKNINIFTRDSPSASYDFFLNSNLSFGGVGALSWESLAVAAEGEVGAGVAENAREEEETRRVPKG